MASECSPAGREDEEEEDEEGGGAEGGSMRSSTRFLFKRIGVVGFLSTNDTGDGESARWLFAWRICGFLRVFTTTGHACETPTMTGSFVVDPFTATNEMAHSLPHVPLVMRRLWNGVMPWGLHSSSKFSIASIWSLPLWSTTSASTDIFCSGATPAHSTRTLNGVSSRRFFHTTRVGGCCTTTTRAGVAALSSTFPFVFCWGW